MEAVLKGRGCKVIYIINGKNTDSGNCHHGAHFKGIENFEVDKNSLFPIIEECRVTKTEKELDVLRYVC
jgi:Xaa-Pro dipeptidase